jgi:hypothetical protein
MTTALTREDLFACFDIRQDLRKVELPGNQHVFIRQLTGAGADAFGAVSTRQPELARATLVVTCVCDSHGETLFVPGDEAAVGELPNRILNPIVEAIIDHNGLREEVAAAVVPTSTTTPSNGCGSGLPATSAAASDS